MLVKFLLLIAIFIGAFLLYQKMRGMPPDQAKRAWQKLAFIGGGMTLLVLTVFGKLPWLFAIIGGLLPFAQKLLAGMRTLETFKSVFGQVTGRASSANNGPISRILTRYFDLQLNQLTGAMSGMILRGRFRGRQLGQLDLEALIEVRAECAVDDPDSAAVIDAYLNQRFGNTWQQPGHQAGSRERSSATPSGSMGRAEALAILGLSEPTTPEAIKDAHRRLMQRMHPDRGGSDYLAAKINQAKDILMG